MAKSPCRISFGGGGTDIEPYCRLYGGCTLAAAIGKYSYAAYFPGNTNHRKPIEQATLKHFSVSGSLITSTSIPPMSGLGGSASLCVAGVKAISPSLDKQEIAAHAYDIERRDMGVLGGYQDQIESALGGLLFIEFLGGTEVNIERMAIPDGLEELLLLVYLGKRNNSVHDIIKDQLARFNKEALDKSKQITVHMKYLLEHQELGEFGKMLNEAWRVKKDFSPFVSSSLIDNFADYALKKGAIGFKLCGAGGGGYGLVMENPSEKGKLRRDLKEYESIKFDTKGVTNC